MGADLLLLTLQRDLLANILEYSADIGRCARSITSQIREIIGVRIVVLFERDLSGAYHLVAACPQRKEHLFTEAEYRRLVALAGRFTKSVLIEPGKGEAGRILADQGLRESFFVPLRVGEEAFGMLVLLDLMDSQGTGQILAGLKDIAGLLSLVLKNSYLYRNMEQLVEQRTRQLVEVETRSQLILQTAMDGFMCVDVAGRLLEVNDAYCAISGYSRAELLTMTLAELEATESPEEIAAHMQGVLANTSARFESKHRCKDGSLVELELSVQLLAGAERQEVAVFLRDITKRNRLEEERIQLQYQLQQAQKMEAIGTLAGGIAHDFNNILSIILGYADLARSSRTLGHAEVRYLDQIASAGERAKDLVQQILTFSRQDRSETAILFPVTIVKEVLRMLRPSLPATIDIVTELDELAGPVEIDPTQLHQILMNLCTNAFQAMESQSGRLSLTLAVHSQRAGFPFGRTRIEPGPFVRLSVGDTGGGIAPDVLDRIFDPFFTTKEPGKGTGMGLSLVHGIVEGCRGFITVDSVLGQGSTFHVHLPVAASEAQAEPLAEPASPEGSGHILLVDDEVMLIEMGQVMLEQLGYRATVCGGSEQALEVFSLQPQAFDLVITDQTMPAMTGIELALRLLQIRPELPVILCSGYNAQISEEQALALGIRAYLPKPFNSAQLAGVLHAILRA